MVYMAEYRGIDVSHHQGVIRWEEVKRAGIQFAMVRASYGWEDKEKQTDAQFHNNVKGAKQAGIPVGAYHYSYATTPEEARKEAAFFLDIIKGYTFEYPLAYDVEAQVQAGLSREQLTEVAMAFCEEVEKAGYYVMIYASKYWLENKLDFGPLKRFDVWLAQWADAATYSGNFGIWQRSNEGQIQGIDTRVDLDTAYRDYEQIIRAAGLNGLAPVQPEKPKPVMRVGAKVEYSGYLYGTSYGVFRGKKVSGTYTVSRIIPKRKCGVLLNDGLGWVKESDCKVVG